MGRSCPASRSSAMRRSFGLSTSGAATGRHLCSTATTPLPEWAGAYPLRWKHE